MMLKRLSALLLLVVLALPLCTAPLVHVAGSASAGSAGDKGRINIAVQTYPNVDKYGFSSVNPDGSFYPNDLFWVSYRVYTNERVDGVTAEYNEGVFEKVSDSGWGSLSGLALFRVRKNVAPGNYTFTVKAWESNTQKVAASGTVKVTYGGVKVDAYYQAQCRLEILWSGGGATSPPQGAYWFAKGVSLQVTAVPDEHYQLDHWLLDGSNAGSSNPITVVMNSPHALQAVFSRIQYSLSISATSGGTTVPAPGTYLYDAEANVSVTAVPYANYTFSHWLLDGVHAGSSNPITVAMNSPHALAAVFKESGSQTSIPLEQSSYVRQEIRESDHAFTFAFVASRGAGSQTSVALGASPDPSEPKLVIADLNWKFWLDVFRGTVCQVTGRLLDSNGNPLPNSEVVVELRKRNFWTGATQIVSKTVLTGSGGRFMVEDTCNPLLERFADYAAWAEKPGYTPSWGLSISTNPTSDEVGQGESLVLGIAASLYGRLTPVPVQLSAGGIPRDCTVEFDPSSANMSALNPLQGVAIFKTSGSTPLGDHPVAMSASSGKVSSSAQFTMKVVPQVRNELSGATFIAHGLDADASGRALTLDGSLAVAAGQLPYTAQWNICSTHSFAWLSPIASKINGKRYVLMNVDATERYLAVATVTVEVVAYDPHFTVFAYTIPNSDGGNSYEKPFAMIVRYDGNGPGRRLDQRAVIESWDWWGYASRMELQAQLLGIPLDISKMSLDKLMELFQLNSSLFGMPFQGVQFSVVGVGKTEGTILEVDGEELRAEDLPKTCSWPVGSTHAYSWSITMPVLKWVESPRWGTGRWEEAGDEWYGWDNTYVSPPQLNETALEGKNETEAQKAVQEAILGKLNSPNGTIVAKEFGCSVTASYAHNRLLSSIAGDAGVQQAVKCLSQEAFPIFFDNKSRYAKIAFQLDGKVTNQTLKEAFNSSIQYEITFLSSMFVQHSFKANFTCPLEHHWKTVEATAWRWDPIGEKFVADNAVAVETVFDTAFSFTYRDYAEYVFKEQAPDQAVLDMVLEDLGECPPQHVFGQSPTSKAIERTSPVYYNLKATAGWGFWEVGDMPEAGDAWTEALRPEGAFWCSAPKTAVSAGSIAACGSASVKASTDSTEWPGAIMYVLKPAYSDFEAGSRLSFKLFLGSGCTGEVAVFTHTSRESSNMTFNAAVGTWLELSVQTPPGYVEAVGIYARVGGDGGWFAVDDLRLTGVRVWKWSKKVNVVGSVAMDFRTDEPYRLHVNLDPTSPLLVNASADDVKRSELTLDALPELGGLQNVTVYLVADAPPGYSLKNVPVGRLTLKKLLTVNLTEPLRKVEGLENYTYYQGYMPTYTSTLGFQGNTTLTIIKSPEAKALPGYGSSLLLIEAQNVWGTRFHTVVAVQPWGKTYFEVLFETIFTVIVGMALAAAVAALVIRLCKAKV